MIELFAARCGPLQKLDRAVDGDVFLIARDQEGDRAAAVFSRLAAAGGEIAEHRGDAAGDAALHVDSAAAVEEAVFHLAREGSMAPGGLIARRHHIGVTGKRDVRRRVSDARIEIVDIGGAGLTKGHAVHFEAGTLEDVFENAERTGISRGYGRAADQIAGNGKGIGHASRLTCHSGGRLPWLGTNSRGRRTWPLLAIPISAEAVGPERDGD